MNIANKRRQSGIVETSSDLLMGGDADEVDEVVIAIVRYERNEK